MIIFLINYCLTGSGISPKKKNTAVQVHDVYVVCILTCYGGYGKLAYYRHHEVEASRIYRQLAHESGNVFSCMHEPSLPPGDIAGAHFCYRVI